MEPTTDLDGIRRAHDGPRGPNMSTEPERQHKPLTAEYRAEIENHWAIVDAPSRTCWAHISGVVMVLDLLAEIDRLAAAREGGEATP